MVACRSLLKVGAFLAVLLLACSSSSPGLAASYYWDADGDYTNGLTDGAGTWDTSALNWNASATPTVADVAWPAGSDAYFGAGGTGGAITVTGTGATLAANSLNFNNFSGTYTLDNTTTAATLNLGAGGININSNSGGGSVTIGGYGGVKDGAQPNLTLNLTANQIWTIASGQTLTVGAFISSPGAPGPYTLTVTGGGTLNFTYASTSVDSFKSLTVANGTVQVTGNVNKNVPSGQTVTLGASGTTGTFEMLSSANPGTFNRNIALAAGGGGVIQIDNPATEIDINPGVIISGDGSLTKSGPGTLGFNPAIATQTYTGILTIADGTFKVASTGSGGPLGKGPTAVVLGDPTHMGTYAYTGTGTGAGSQHTRGFTIKAGGGQIANTNTAASGNTLTVQTGAITGTAGGLLTVGGTGNTVINSVISNNGGLTKLGTGTLTLGGANSYSGDTVISAGTLKLTNANSLAVQSSTLNYTTTGGTLSFDTMTTAASIGGLKGDKSLALTNTNATPAAVALTLSGSGIAPNSYSGNLSGGNGLTKSGADDQTFSGTNSYAGDTTVSGGTLTFSGTSTLGNTSGALAVNNPSNLFITPVVLNLNQSQTVGALSGSILAPEKGNTATINLTGAGATALTVNQTSNTTFAGVLAGANGGLTKQNTGTLTLSGANTYGGPTTIENAGGGLMISGSLTGTGAVSVGTTPGTPSYLGGSGSIAGPVTVNGHLAPTQPMNVLPTGTNPNPLTIANNLALSNGAALDFNFGNAGVGNAFGTSDLVSVTGSSSAFTLGANTTLNISVISGSTFGPGYYKLIDYKDAGGANNVASTFTLGPGNQPSTYDYFVVAPGDAKYPNWAGTNALLLDVAVKSSLLTWSRGTGTWNTGSANWNGNAATYADGKDVLFDNTPGTGAYTVNISTGAGVQPKSVVFSNTSSGASYTFTGEGINGPTDVTIGGTGTVTLNNANGYTGATKVDAGVLNVGVGGTGSLASTSVTVLSVAALNVGSGGTLASTTALTTDGATSFSNASQTLASLAGGSTGVVTLNGTALTVSAAPTFTGTINGTGGLVYNIGSSTTTTYTGLILDYTGPTTINGTGGGVMQVSANSNFGNTTTQGGVNLNNATLQITTGFATSRAITVGDANSTIQVDALQTLTLNSPMAGTGAGALTKSGSGTLILNGASMYAGATSVNDGILRLANATALPGGTAGDNAGTSNLILNGGTLELASGDLLRGLGTGGDNVRFTGSGGFAAVGAARIVNLGLGGGTSTSLVWGTGGTPNFLSDSGTLYLGSATDTHTVDFQNAIDLGASVRTVQVARGAAALDATLSGQITGSGGGLTKTGNGLLALTNSSNSYTGQTSVNGGTLSISSNTNLGDPATGAAINLNGGALQATASFGLYNVTAGTNDRAVALGASGGAFDVTGSNNLAVSGVVSSTVGGGLTKTGSGTLTLSSSNTYTGPTSINGGILSISSNANLGDESTGAALNLNGGTLQTTATFGLYNGMPLLNPRAVTLGAGGGTFNVAGGTTLEIVGFIYGSPAGSGVLTKTGSGTLFLNYIGGTMVGTPANDVDNYNKLVVADGTVQVNNENKSFPMGTPTNPPITLGAVGTPNTTGTIELLSVVTGTKGTNRGIVLVGGGGVIQVDNAATVWQISAANLNYVVTGPSTAPLTKTGPGEFDILGLIGTPTGSLGNTYTGALTIAAGTFGVNTTAAGGALGKGTTAVTLGAADGSTAGTFAYKYAGSQNFGRGFTIAAGGGQITNTNTIATNALTVQTNPITGTDGGSLTFGGTGNTTVTSDINLSGGPGGGNNLTKTGTGTLTLAGANSYTGLTDVQAGALTLTGSATTSSVTVTATGTLELSRAGAASALLTNTPIANEGNLSVTTAGQEVGAISGAGTTTVNGSLTAASIVQNTLSIGAGGTVTIRETTGGSVSAVPEPGTVVLLAAGAAGLLAWSWRRRKEFGV